MHTDRCGNTRRQKCCAKGSGNEVKIQEFMYRHTTNVEHEMYDYTSNNLSHWNSKVKLKKNLEALPGKHSIDSLKKTAILCSWSGLPTRPRTQLCYHHDTKVKPEAAAAVIELLMMGGRTPETCWAVNKRQDNKLENCCIWLVICLNCTMVHGISNLKCRLCTVMWELNPEILFR
jgi:hypothetical protein